MEKLKHIILIIALFVIAVIFNLSLKEIKGKPTGVLGRDLAIKTDASAHLSGVLYTKTVKDYKEFMIKAKSAEYFKDDGKSVFDDIDAKFYSKSGNVYNMTGDTGSYDTNDNTISVSGDVLLKSDDGYELSTDTVYYSREKNALTSEDIVRLKKGDITLEGVGMELDLINERINIHEKVKGHVKGT